VEKIVAAGFSLRKITVCLPYPEAQPKGCSCIWSAGFGVALSCVPCSGQRSAVSGQLSAVSCQRSAISGQLSAFSL